MEALALATHGADVSSAAGRVITKGKRVVGSRPICLKVMQ